MLTYTWDEHFKYRRVLKLPFESRGMRLTAFSTSTCSFPSERLYTIMSVTAPYFSPWHTFCNTNKQWNVPHAGHADTHTQTIQGWLLYGDHTCSQTFLSKNFSISCWQLIECSIKWFCSVWRDRGGKEEKWGLNTYAYFTIYLLTLVKCMFP